MNRLWLAGLIVASVFSGTGAFAQQMMQPPFRFEENRGQADAEAQPALALSPVTTIFERQPEQMGSLCMPWLLVQDRTAKARGVQGSAVLEQRPNAIQVHTHRRHTSRGSLDEPRSR